MKTEKRKNDRQIHNRLGDAVFHRIHNQILGGIAMIIGGTVALLYALIVEEKGKGILGIIFLVAGLLICLVVIKKALLTIYMRLRR